MDTTVQWVRTWWTKRSRGGPEATRRNAAPVGFRLPVTPGVHVVTMHEQSGFVPDEEVVAALAPDAVELTETTGLRVRLLPDRSGIPRHSRAPAVVLAPGQWLRWHINYRIGPSCSCGSEWRYRLDTLNVAYGVAGADVFLGTPDRLVDQRTYLR